MNKKKRILILFCIIFVLLITTIFVSYAYYETKISGNESSKKAVFNSQIIKVEYSDGTEELTTNQEGYFIPGSVITKTFTIKNTGNVKVNYSVNLTEIKNEFKRPEDLTYEITDGTTTYSGIFPEEDTYIISKDVLNVDESKTYTLTIKYLESEENQIIDSGKTINAKVTINDRVITLKKLNIYGNSIQDTLTYGEPTPTNPVEIQSLGDKTNNLFNQTTTKTATLTPGANTNARKFEEGVWYLGLTYNNYSYPNNLLDYRFEGYTTMVKVNGQKLYGLAQAFKTEPNKTYVFNYETVTEGRVGFGFYDIDGNFLSFKTWKQGQSVKTPENTYWMTVCISGMVENIEINYSNIQLVLSDTLPEYEPYGYKIPISIKGKNLFDYKKVNDENKYIISTSGQPYTPSTGQWRYSDYIEVNPSQTYHYNANNSNANVAGIAWYDENKQYISGQNTTVVNNNNGVLEAPNNARYIRISWKIDAGYNPDWQNTIQLEEGTTSTDFESFKEPLKYTIYLNEPLRKVGDCENCSDYIDFENNKIVRNISTIIYDGSSDEIWGTYGENQLYYGYKIDLSKIYHNIYVLQCLCDRLPGMKSYAKIWYGTELGCYAGLLSPSSTNTSFAISSSQQTIEDLREELKEKPLKILFVQRDVENIEINNLPNIEVLQNETNNIKVCSSNGVCASNVEVELDS